MGAASNAAIATDLRMAFGKNEVGKYLEPIYLNAILEWVFAHWHQSRDWCEYDQSFAWKNAARMGFD